MTKVDIFSGFLGAGKTTLIKKLIKEVYNGEKLVLIENEFGEIGIDGGFLQDAGINITEMNSGCICCSLVGDFGKALEKVMAEFNPDRIIIEPSGVGKLSDVIIAVQKQNIEGLELNSFTTVADAGKCKMYMKNFGEFFNNQVEHANSIVLSRTSGMSEAKLSEVVSLLREHNTAATIITTPWEDISGEQILETMEHRNTLEEELKLLAEEQEHEHHHHHDHDEECTCGCHDHHHDDDDDDDEHEHHHHHDHGEECTCGCHDHHHHHADEIFTSWGVETIKKYTPDFIKAALTELDSGKFGTVLRAKGIISAEDGTWIHFDYVPGEQNVRTGSAATMGRLCVIGSELDETKLAVLFNV